MLVRGRDDRPYHASLVIVVSNSLPSRTNSPDQVRIDHLVADGRAGQVITDGQQHRQLPGVKEEKSATAPMIGPAKNSTDCSGTYSPKGTRCILRYTAPDASVGFTRNAAL